MVEQWNPNSKWLGASPFEREGFMKAVGNAMKSLSEQGVEIISWNANDLDTSRRAEFAFFAVWRFPSIELARTFESAVAQSGWHEYFDHQNLRGKSESPEAIIGRHIGLGVES